MNSFFERHLEANGVVRGMNSGQTRSDPILEADLWRPFEQRVTGWTRDFQVPEQFVDHTNPVGKIPERDPSGLMHAIRAMFGTRARRHDPDGPIDHVDQDP